MSEETKETTTERKTFKLSDDIIALVRDLLQLSLLTNSNIIDHLRAVVVEAETARPQYLTLTPEYVEAYNAHIEKLNQEAQAAVQAAQARLADDDAEQPS
jgi:hypothetical protein